MTQPEPKPCGCGSDTCLACLFDQGQLTKDEYDAYLMKPWRAAKSLADLAGLTADWIEGKLQAHPGWSGRPNPETDQIADQLIALNRRGWLTIDSQPGHEANKHGEVQRHAVKLILTPDQVEKLDNACDHVRDKVEYLQSWATDLIPDPETEWDAERERRWADPVMVSGVLAPGERNAYPEDDGVKGTCWFGTGPGPDWEFLFGDGEADLTDELRVALGGAKVVAIAAPKWGSDDGGLWKFLRELATERREMRIETVCACDTVVAFTPAARVDPEAPGGVFCEGPGWDWCPECGEKVAIPACAEAGHSWTELTAAGQSIVVCLACKQRRKPIPAETAGGVR